MSEKRPFRIVQRGQEGYQPTDGKGCDPVTGKLDLTKLKPPKGGTAVQPPQTPAPSQPQKPPDGQKPS